VRVSLVVQNLIDQTPSLCYGRVVDQHLDKVEAVDLVWCFLVVGSTRGATVESGGVNVFALHGNLHQRNDGVCVTS
jgi:hypothetical protein